MTDVETYIKKVKGPEQAVLQHIADLVRREVPDTEETTSYGLPTFKYKGKSLIGFAANKNFMSLYPFSGKILNQMEHQLKGFDYTPGALRFTVDHPVTDDLIRQILALRIYQITS